MAKPVYLGAFLSPEDRQALLRAFPPRHPNVTADHVTWQFSPKDEHIAQFNPLIGQTSKAKVIGHHSDEYGQAVTLQVPHPLGGDPSKLHITLSTANGVHPVTGKKLGPVYSNELIAKGQGQTVDGPELNLIHDQFPRTLGKSMNKNDILLTLAKAIIDAEETLAKGSGGLTHPYWDEKLGTPPQGYGHNMFGGGGPRYLPSAQMEQGDRIVRHNEKIARNAPALQNQHRVERLRAMRKLGRAQQMGQPAVSPPPAVKSESMDKNEAILTLSKAILDANEALEKAASPQQFAAENAVQARKTARAVQLGETAQGPRQQKIRAFTGTASPIGHNPTGAPLAGRSGGIGSPHAEYAHAAFRGELRNPETRLSPAAEEHLAISINQHSPGGHAPSGRYGWTPGQQVALGKTATFGVYLTHPQYKAAKRDGKSDEEALEAAKEAIHGKEEGTVRDTNEEANKAPNR